MTEDLITVGMGEIKVSAVGSSPPSGGSVLAALGLGSCIGICAYERYARVAGMAHVVLPESAGAPDCPGKFADTAVPALLHEMQKLGAIRSRISVAIVGGAQLFSIGPGIPRMEIGVRNAQSVLAQLKAHGIDNVIQDVGGSTGRTVKFYVADGHVRVKTIGRGEQYLTRLGQPLSSDP